MTLAPEIDAAATGASEPTPGGGAVAPAAMRYRWTPVAINRSPLARKIIVFNLLAILMLVAGVLALTPFRESLALQRERALVTEAGLIAAVVEARLPAAEASGVKLLDVAAARLAEIDLAAGTHVRIFQTGGALVASRRTPPRPEANAGSLMIDALNRLIERGGRLFAITGRPDALAELRAQARGLVAEARAGGTRVRLGMDAAGRTVFTAARPIRRAGETIGVLVVSSGAGEIDALVRSEREQVLQMFVIATVVSIGLSLVLASMIANPLAELAAAAETGRDRNAGRVSPGRVRIPDLTARRDEIGRLSGALRGMVAALYDRIDANEQFAADVAHEIKNPLASLRSAVGAFHLTERTDQRARLLEVIEHDVRRLDRLVSDISNASRLDSELVKEREDCFDLVATLRTLTDYLSIDAERQGVELFADLPGAPVTIEGLENRLAQVFVNLIGNAVSFCAEGDAIRVWLRQRENRVLVVVEDTGPGIPEAALSRIFARFYSERPSDQFGNNSGLGLAISKQIVEAHGGVIWAENIRPTDADPTSAPLGARLVVGLPV